MQAISTTPFRSDGMITQTPVSQMNGHSPAPVERRQTGLAKLAHLGKDFLQEDKPR
jgi:hypothetical protein